ncbi:hypothetical protein HOC01_01475 [archaeon]|jgi:hypothetical protein|nr:hypothetical protein [archaeon]MBT6698011.1 hypothetical protein [archaeon]
MFDLGEIVNSVVSQYASLYNDLSAAISQPRYEVSSLTDLKSEAENISRPNFMQRALYGEKVLFEVGGRLKPVGKKDAGYLVFFSEENSVRVDSSEHDAPLLKVALDHNMKNTVISYDANTNEYTLHSFTCVTTRGQDVFTEPGPITLSIVPQRNRF